MSAKISFSAAVFALPALCAPAQGARFCHDLKGLYKPCPEAVGAPAVRRSNTAKAMVATAPAVAADAAAASPDAAPASPPVPPRAFHRKVTAHLCHDLKGLYHPCTG